jgi:hypothetical protein
MYYVGVRGCDVGCDVGCDRGYRLDCLSFSKKINNILRSIIFIYDL